MQFAYKEMLSRLTIMVNLIMACALVGVFATLGSTLDYYDSISRWQRFGYSVLYAAISMPLGYSIAVVTAYFLRRRSTPEMALALTVAALYLAAPYTCIVHTVGIRVYPHYLANLGLPRLYVVVATATVVSKLLLLCFVYLRVKHADVLAAVRDAAAVEEDGAETSAALAASVSGGATEHYDAGGDGADIDQQADRLPASQAAQPATGDRTVPAPLSAVPANRALVQAGDGGSVGTLQGRELLHKEFGNDVIFLKSEDHYVHVHTSAGLTMIKMRFADAVAKLGDSGIQVHRCYWVAYHHMRGLTKRDRKLLLQLTGGHQVPISARHRAAVNALLKSSERV